LGGVGGYHGGLGGIRKGKRRQKIEDKMKISDTSKENFRKVGKLKERGKI
jgi:hypothetical protein